MRLTISRSFIVAVVIMLLAAIGFIFLQAREDLAASKRVATSPSAEVKSSPRGFEELAQTYIDPATGVIPPGIRSRELEFARTLSKRNHALSKRSNASLFNWASAGPNNRAGRSRGLVVDINDSNTIIAGGVSSGVWKSTDGGVSWSLKTAPGVSYAVTTIAQDPRAGQNNTWYFAGGEFRGGTTSSDRGFWAPYMGAGIFKSTDNGETWQLLPSTKDSDPTTFNSAFDYVHRLAISPTTGTVFVANNASGIYRSTDGGASFPRVLGGLAQHAWSDVAVGANGVVVAILSQQTQGATQQTNPSGVYKSNDDGLTWTRITPATFPSTHQRSVLAIAPSNPDLVYALTFTGQTLSDGREDMRFHKINLRTNFAEDRSANLPRYSGRPEFGAAIHAWTNFCMVLAVKPDDENFVVAGGNRNETHIGGYADPNSGGAYNAPTNVDDKPITAIPLTFHLSQNFPNPFNPKTRIAFELPTASRVTLKIFDVTGRTISELLNNQVQSSGRHEVIFTPRGFASGTYFYELKAVPLHPSIAPFATRKAMSFIK